VSKPISQREARSLRKRVEELERAERSRANRWASEWVGGTSLFHMPADAYARASVATSRLLGHAVVVTLDGSDLHFHAIRLQARQP
jgi:hypothetical protein